LSAKRRVKNRGEAPNEFLAELEAWARIAPEEIFAMRPGQDIYSNVAALLRPYAVGDLIYRKAVMMEVLRVLGGFESPWKWGAGVDVTNPASDKPCTMEAGIFQVSGDSTGFDAFRKALVKATAKTLDCETFRKTTQQNHPFAIEYCARLLRFSTRHHGPIRDHRIDQWVSKDAVDEFKAALLEN
jgi:hypothetical protein